MTYIICLTFYDIILLVSNLMMIIKSLSYFVYQSACDYFFYKFSYFFNIRIKYNAVFILWVHCRGVVYRTFVSDISLLISVSLLLLGIYKSLYYSTSLNLVIVSILNTNNTSKVKFTMLVPKIHKGNYWKF